MLTIRRLAGYTAKKEQRERSSKKKSGEGAEVTSSCESGVEINSLSIRSKISSDSVTARSQVCRDTLPLIS